MTVALAAQLGFSTYVVVWFLKFLLPGPAAVNAPNQDRQENLLRLFVYLTAVCVCAISVPLVGVHGWTDVAILVDIKTLAVDGFVVFGVAVGTYHVTDKLSSKVPAMRPFSGSISIATEGLPIPGAPVQETPAA